VDLRAQILEKSDLEEEKLYIPEWDCTILVRALNGADRANLLQNNTLASGKPDLKKMYPALAILSMRDPDTHKLIFEPADRDALNTKSGAALERVAEVAIRLNHLTPDAVKDAEKNS